jgi:hypothetical protein
MSDKDKDKDNPFGPPPEDDPFGRKRDEPSSFEDIWARADQPQQPQPPPPPPRPDPYGPPPNEAWRADPSMPQDPFVSSGYGAPAPAPQQRADAAIPALVLGILGLVLCPICAPFAWALGRKAEIEVDASGGMLAGRGEATAGKILGIITCVLYAVFIVGLVLIIAIGASNR